jgi:hypothetical protein
MERRDFLRTIGCGTAALLAGCATEPKRAPRTAARTRLQQARGRPNILWLISEDTCPDLACYGKGTPNARQGVGDPVMPVLLQQHR